MQGYWTKNCVADCRLRLHLIPLFCFFFSPTLQKEEYTRVNTVRMCYKLKRVNIHRAIGGPPFLYLHHLQLIDSEQYPRYWYSLFITVFAVRYIMFSGFTPRNTGQQKPTLRAILDSINPHSAQYWTAETHTQRNTGQQKLTLRVILDSRNPHSAQYYVLQVLPAHYIKIPVFLQKFNGKERNS